jgi:hypothetical protein
MIAIADGRSNIEETAEKSEEDEWGKAIELETEHDIEGDDKPYEVEQDDCPTELGRGDLVLLNYTGPADSITGVSSLDVIKIVICYVGNKMDHETGNENEEKSSDLPSVGPGHEPTDDERNQCGYKERRTTRLYPRLYDLTIHGNPRW